MGIATPTEAGALGAVGAMLLAWMNGRLSKDNLEDALDDTVQLTTMVVFLLIGSTAFTIGFRGLYGDIWIEDFLVNLPREVGAYCHQSVGNFCIGFFIDFFEIAFILLPLLVPAAKLLGIDLVWFAVLMAMNLQTSFLRLHLAFHSSICVVWHPKKSRQPRYTGEPYHLLVFNWWR